MSERAAVTTFLFTDIEGSTRLWEREPERMQHALAAHDALAHGLVGASHGSVVKTTGDGFYAVFDDPADALHAAIQLQVALNDPQSTGGLPLRVRCGVHAGVREHRDNDFFGHTVNRAARIMSAGHGGQILLSKAVMALVHERLPQDVQLRSLGLVHLRDMMHPEELYQVLHPALREAFPPLRSLAETPNNLPQEVTSFVGRERELAHAKELLGSTRVLTLVGAGGLGKTRLSLQVARAVLGSFPDGAWLIELAPIADPQRVPETLASVLGVKEDAGRPVLEAVQKFVADRHLLVILDNCEHVVQACAELVRALLQAAPRVTVLASSRERLHVAGECVLEVPALAVPLARERASAASVLECDAVRLFRDRAVAAQSSFEITDTNAASVAEICRRLDGIPLALELAAARVRSLGVAEIARRLDDRFRLLTGGDRTAMPRQRTLRALIDWSYDLLTSKERVLLQYLAVFSGGWTLEAAETVAGGDEIEPSEVLDVLADLVDKSLVMVEASGDRYGLLETVRQYAQERLKAAGAEDVVRRRHLDFYLGLAEKAGPGLAGPEQPAFIRQLDLDLENVLAAHEFCTHSVGAAECGYRLVHAIRLYWFTRGLLDLGHRVTVEAVSAPAARSTSLHRCKALWVAGQICGAMGRYEEAQRYLQESLGMARELDDQRMVVSVLNMLGLAALGQGDRAAARRHGMEALSLATKLDNKRQIAVASNALAQIHRLEGELDAAEPLYERAGELARELGDSEFAAVALLNLAMVAIERRMGTRARSLLLDVLTITEQSGSKRAGQCVLEVCAGLAALCEQWEHAARFYGAAERQTADTGIRRDPADDAFLRHWISVAQDVLGDAAFRALATSARDLTYEQGIAEARRWLERDDSSLTGACITRS